MVAHRAQLGQVEFQADHEHQEHNTEFTKVAYPVRTFRQSQSIGSYDHADHQVAQHRRQLERSACHDPQYRGQQVHQGELERVHRHILARDAPVYKMAPMKKSPAQTAARESGMSMRHAPKANEPANEPGFGERVRGSGSAARAEAG